MKQRTAAIIISYLALGIATPSCGKSVGEPVGGGPTATTSTSTNTDMDTCISNASCGPGAFCTDVPTHDGECAVWQCVPCSPTSGEVCDDQGHVYASQCAALDAGVGSGLPCAPAGTTLCHGHPPAFCNTSTEVCVEGTVTDCGGVTPAICMPLAVDGGGPDGG